MLTLDLAAAAAFLGLHPDTLRERTAAGIVPGAKIGKEWRFLESDLRDYFRAQYGAKGKPKKWRSTVGAQSGGSISGTAGAELDDLLEHQSKRPRSGSTTNLRLVSGKNAKAGAS